MTEEEEKKRGNIRNDAQASFFYLPIQLSSFFSLDCLFLSVMSRPLFCLSSSINISRQLFPSPLTASLAFSPSDSSALERDDPEIRP